VSPRPSKATYFLDIAEAVSKRATCPRLSVGAVFVGQSGNILTTGYNGAPRNMGHCLDVGCEIVHNHCKRALHAERNGIIWAAREGISLVGSILYLTHEPCADCVLHIHQAGVQSVLYRHEYYNELATRFAMEAGLMVWKENQ
jgi:dCMP deaminase